MRARGSNGEEARESEERLISSRPSPGSARGSAKGVCLAQVAASISRLDSVTSKLISSSRRKSVWSGEEGAQSVNQLQVVIPKK